MAARGAGWLGLLREAARAAAGALVLAAALSGPLRAEGARHAFVVGIDDYDEIDDLKTAVADARAVAAALTAAGFTVLPLENPSRSVFSRHLHEFTRRLSEGDEAVFYFAGHGIAIDGENYLLPRSVPALTPDAEALAIDESIGASAVIERIRATRARVVVAILDACRNNPFPEAPGRAGVRLGDRDGLVTRPPTRGTLVLYAASTGQTALDRLNAGDAAGNSVFTRHLLPLLSTPGLEVRDMVGRLRDAVEQAAASVGHPQRPAYIEDLTGEFYFTAPLPADAQGPAGDSAAAYTPADGASGGGDGGGGGRGGACDLLYREARDLAACHGYRGYLSACAEHPMAPLARAFLDETCPSAPAAAAPPTGPEPAPEAEEPATVLAGLPEADPAETATTVAPPADTAAAEPAAGADAADGAAAGTGAEPAAAAPLPALAMLAPDGSLGREAVAPPTDCDRLAGYPFRRRVNVPGVAIEEIDAERALNLCYAASAMHPDEPFFLLIAARALYKLRPGSAEVAALIDRGAPADPIFAANRRAYLIERGEGGFARDAPAALALYREGCALGLGVACTQAGMLLRAGAPGVAADPIAAQAALRDGCRAEGPTHSCAELGRMLESAPPTPGTLRAAVAAWRLGCDAGEAEACGELGRAVGEGLGGLTRVPAEARRLYGIGCDGGNADVCLRLAGHERRGSDGGRTDPAAALRHLRRACDLGSAEGCREAGIMLAEGEGVAADQAAARALFTRACDRRDGDGCAWLGYMAENGQGGATDPVLAVTLHQLACDLGQGWSCNRLGRAYRLGQLGFARDLVRAAALFNAACTHGNAAGCGNLGLLYSDGDASVTDDLPRAAELLEGACARDVALACAEAGRLAADGAAGPKDPELALRLFRKGCDLDDGPACRALGRALEPTEAEGSGHPLSAAAYGKGCDLGDGEACLDLANLLVDRRKVTDPATGRDLTRETLLSLRRRACEVDVPACYGLIFTYGAGNPNYADEAEAAAATLMDVLAGDDPDREQIFADIDRYGMNRHLARALQTRLREAGHYGGAIDGIFGAGSLAALRAHARLG